MSYWEECMYDWHGGPDPLPDPIYEVNATLVHETEKAYLFEHTKGKFWAPKSAVISFGGGQLCLHNWFRPKRLEEK